MDLEWWSKFHVILCLLVFTTFQKPLLCWRQTCTRILRNEDNEGGLCWSSWRQLKVSERLKFYEVLKSSEKSEMQKETAEALRSWSRNPRPTSSPCPSRSRPHPPMMSAAKMARAEKPTKKAPMRPEDQNGSKWIEVDQSGSNTQNCTERRQRYWETFSVFRHTLHQLSFPGSCLPAKETAPRWQFL